MTEPAAAAGSLTTAIFNPALLRKEDLLRGFVARQDLLTRMLDDLRRVQPASPPQHQIVIGQRGLGKTTLLRRMAFAIEDDPELSKKWIPLVFPEEQYNVKNLADFWLNCVDALSDALDRMGDQTAAELLDEKVANIPAQPARRATESLSLLVSEAERLNRGLVLLVDNLDIVLDRLQDKEEWAFRRVISAEHRLYFIGASSRALEALYEHGRAFYDYFHVHELKGFTDEEMFSLLGRLAEAEPDAKVKEILARQPSRIRALRVLTGGNPRTLMLLYRVLSQGPDGDVERDIEQLLDLHTPLYKARFEELPTQSQQIVDALAIHWDPITAGDLAAKLYPLSVNQVSAQLKRLEDFGIVEKTPWYGEKKAAFQITERFFNIWYLMRASRRVRRRLIWLVRFLEAWFERDELSVLARKHLERDPDAVGPERYTEMAFAYSQTVGDKYLRRNLESAALRASLDCSVRDLIDLSDLPPEISDRRARMSKLRELSEQISRATLGDMDNQEFARLLLGSPHLNLAQKQKIVAELPALAPDDLRDLHAKLTRAERILSYTYRETSPAVERLYLSLASGELVDAYDLDGALALANQWGCKWLPIVAIASRVDPSLSGEIPIEELDNAIEALNNLANEPEYEARVFNCLGNLLADRGRVEEATEAYQKAIGIDPAYARPWANLCLLEFDAGRRDRAEAFARRAIETDPIDPQGWKCLGRVQEEILADLGSAEDAYRRALELDRGDAEAWHVLGSLLAYSPGKADDVEAAYLKDAEQAYRKSIELYPYSSGTFNNLGNVLLDLGRFDEAQHSYRTGIDVDPQSPFPWGNLARLFEHQRKSPSETLSAFLKAAELDITTDWRRGEVLRFARKVASSGDLKNAVETVTRVSELFAGNAETRFTLAGLFALNKNWVQAEEIFRALASEETGQPEPWAFRAAIQSGHASDLINVLKEIGANERWRPMYEALRAVVAGTRDYLSTVAPEIRDTAETILSQIAPDLGKTQTRGKKRRRKP